MPPHVSQVEVALLERLFDRSPDVAFFVKDAAGRYVAVNESLVARFEEQVASHRQMPA